MGNPGRFRFTLARVLGVREIERRLAGGRVAEATARLREAVRSRDDAKRGRDQLGSELALLRSAERLDIPSCLAVEVLFEGARAAVSRWDEVVAAKEADRAAAIALYAESHKKVEALTRVRSAREEAHAQERRDWESKTTDEVAAARAQNALPGSLPLPVPLLRTEDP